METCDRNHDHQAMTAALAALPSLEETERLAALFKLFGDSTRIRILAALLKSELCVCELADMLNMTQSAISHQLRVLKGARAVKSRRSGKQMIYALHDAHILRIFEQGLVHIVERDA